MKEITKNKIRKIVSDYIRIYPLEYENFNKGMRVKQGLQKNKFSKVDGSDLVERLLFEIPETLDTLISLKLTPEELEAFRSRQGSIWFAKNFAAFRMPEKV